MFTIFQQNCLFYIILFQALLQYTGHAGSVNSLRFHPSKELVLTASGDGTAHIWQCAVHLTNESSSGRMASSEDELDPLERESSQAFGKILLLIWTFFFWFKVKYFGKDVGYITKLEPLFSGIFLYLDIKQCSLISENKSAIWKSWLQLFSSRVCKLFVYFIQWHDTYLPSNT